MLVLECFASHSKKTYIISPVDIVKLLVDVPYLVFNKCICWIYCYCLKSFGYDGSKPCKRLTGSSWGIVNKQSRKTICECIVKCPLMFMRSYIIYRVLSGVHSQTEPCKLKRNSIVIRHRSVL